MAEGILKSTYLGGSGLSLNPSLPLAEQVADYYRSMITNGELHFGDELPPAKNFEGVSHVTVLNAYRKLADEGYIHLQRAKRTRVAKNFECQRYVILSPYKKESVLFEDALYTKCQQLAFYNGRKPDVFYLGHGNDIRTLSEAKAAIPDSLNTLVNQGLVRAALIHLPEHIPGIIKWIQEKDIPYVSLNPTPGETFAYFDYLKIHEDAVRLLAGKGCSKINVFPWHWEKPPSGLTGLFKEFPGLTWGRDKFSPDHDAPIEAGRRFASACLNSSRKIPDALIVADDIAGLGALVTLKEKGLRIPQDIRLLITSHRSQILPIFSGCDLIMTSFDDLVIDAVSLVEEIINGNQPTGTTRAIGYSILSGEKTTNIDNLS